MAHGSSTRSGLGHLVDGVIDFSAGTAGGIACVYAGQPLDTVKVKLQTFPQYYRNAFQCFWQTLSKDGIARGLYAGTVPALAANIAENSVLFAAYGACQKIVALVAQRKVPDLQPVHNACAGSMAAFFASLVLCPTELVKCRLQALREMQTSGQGSLGHGEMSGMKIGPWSLTRQILRQEGVLGLFTGLTPTFAREVPGYFFFFGAYDTAKQFLTPVGKTKDDIGLLRTSIAGGIGGVCLWTAIFPADVVKSRVQVQGSGSFLATLMGILKTDGFRALYKGLGPTIVRTFFASGALFIAYEATKRGLNDLLNH